MDAASLECSHRAEAPHGFGRQHPTDLSTDAPQVALQGSRLHRKDEFGRNKAGAPARNVARLIIAKRDLCGADTDEAEVRREVLAP